MPRTTRAPAAPSKPVAGAPEPVLSSTLPPVVVPATVPPPVVAAEPVAVAVAVAVAVGRADGRVAADGPPGEVLTEALLTEVYRHPVEVLPHPRTGHPLVLPRR